MDTPLSPFFHSALRLHLPSTFYLLPSSFKYFRLFPKILQKLPFITPFFYPKNTFFYSIFTLF